MKTEAEPVASFVNEEEQMEARVWVSTVSGFNVTLCDLDSGETVPTAFVGIATLELAIAKAKTLVRVP